MTIDVSTKWLVEVFPFESTIPSSSDFGGSAPSIGLKKEEKPLDEILSDNLGITSVSLSRNKGTPDGSCQISIAGPLSPKFYVGVWAIVSSFTSDNNGLPFGMVRFIGQIENVDVSYIMSETGNSYIQSNIKIREWSSMLRMLVRYDITSIYAQATDVGKEAITQKLLSLAAGDSAEYNIISSMMKDAFDPYEFAHIILLLIGAMNTEDATSRAKGATEGTTLPNIATIAPYIPSSVLDRLDITQEFSFTGNPKGPFQSGFVKVITGIQKGGVYNNRGWDGTFSSPSIDDLAKNYEKGHKDNPIHPFTSGLQNILGMGASAWDLLSTQCDNAINEVYTDFLYERNEIDEITSKPVIVIRNKPFMLKKIQENKIDGIAMETDVSAYAVYDDLPRHEIPTESILQFRINSTFINSPNYIRVSYSPTVTSDSTGNAQALAAGIERLDPEMKRFGGSEIEIPTLYNGHDGFGFDGEKNRKIPPWDIWYKQLKSLAKAWNSYNYRMGTGILSLKENSLPLSIGNNVQFQFGQYRLVGHIEAINCDFRIESDGLGTNHTTLTLTHIVQDTGYGLDFIDMTHFGNLLQSTPTTSKESSGVSAQLNKLKDKFVGAVTGAFKI